ncbi:fibronectin type III domain-containing protein [Candidatus Woesearchaeota archaeon]|nr:fibronectin type III domain-containing protein [Candidatus Woesearchaeota archaeon]
MKSKINEIITIFLIQLVLTLPFYTANVYGLTISNIRVTKVSSNSATIEWSTDEISDGRVRYGQTTALGFTQRHDNFISNHTITVFNGINSDTPYFFAVESTDLNGNIAIDNRANSFYTFKTTDITPPPQVNGLNLVSTTPNSIFLSWNSVNIADFSHYVIYRNRIPVANFITNSFNDTNLQSNTNFNYKISAVDNSGNEGPQSDTLIASTSAIDSAIPVISNLEALPLTDAAARITWITNENSTTTVLYGVNKTDKIKSSDDLVTNHSIVIDSLAKGAKHIIIAKSCDASNNCANFSLQNFVAGKEFNLAVINISIPRFVNRRVIDLVGSAKQFSSITLFVNNMNIPKRSLSSAEIDASGNFVFSNIQLEQDNIIRVDVVDKFGTKHQKLFEVSVDTEDPTIQLNDIPSLTSKTELAISGATNEPGKINVFVDANVKEITTPSKITGLNAVKAGQNSIELNWDESKDKDFSHYVVYRENAGPIALTKPANFNLYIDALVDSGRSYTYQVSAVNILGKEGEKSEPVTAATLQGGAILNLQTPEVDIFEDFRKPLMVVNVSSPFSFSIKLNKGDGTYLIKMIFEDRAGNSVVVEKSVTLDTKIPEVKILSPPSGAFIFENVANEIEIIGKTKPNARVHLFVDRTPFSFFNQTLEVSGLPNEIQNLPEAQLDAKCRSSVSASFCRTGADFSVDADARGDFKFEKVDLTVIFGGAGRLREVPVAEFRDTILNPEAQESKRTTLVVIATDQAGLRGVATQQIRLGTCWSGNQSWDIIPLTQYQSPVLLSAERLRDGVETLYFYFNYSYIGRGTSARISTISISKACSTKETLDPRFNISCQIMPGGNSPKLLNPPDNTVSYSAMTLNRFPGMEQFMEDDWKSFFKAINNELTIPLKVTIAYKHDTDNDGQIESEVQTTCEQVSYAVDKSIIDPRKVLPDWLLFDFVDFLQSSIETLTKLQEQINTLLEFVVVGCFASFGLNIGLQIYRRWTDFWEEKKYAISNALKFNEIVEAFKLAQNTGGSEDDCKLLIKDIKAKRGSFKLAYVNDIELKKCFPASAAAWESEAKVYSLMRWSCDRVFGHAAPSKWTENRDDTQLLAKIQSGEGCAADQSVRGQPLRLINCKNAQLSAYGATPDQFGIDDKCFEVESGTNKALLTFGQQVGNSNIYTINHLKGSRNIEIQYAIRKDETNFLASQSKSCAELCGVKNTFNQQQVAFADSKSNIVLAKDPKTKKPDEVGYTCTTVDTCRSFNQNKEIIDGDGKKHKISSAFTMGYTSKISNDKNSPPCFYANGKSESVVSDLTSQREECCCINAKETKEETHYYGYKDTDITTGKPVHESKKLNALDISYAGPESLDDIKWSYRYSKEKFKAKGEGSLEHNQYHPQRYIEGRDESACFGQNNIFYDGFKTDDGNVLAVDPFKEHVAAFQCINLGGINNRIQFLKNLMASLSTCLIQVRTTGRGDAGACKEVFTQYLCGAIWQVVRSFVDKCSPLGFGAKLDTDDEGLATYLRAGSSSIFQSLSDVQRSVSEEYGNAKLNELLGTGEESISRKICLAAFGYDWEFNLKNLVDAAYAQPFATLVQPITRSREFLTVDPVSFKPKYEYRASWLINPGCDFERYNVFLTCAGRKQLDKYPNNINCGALGAPSIAYTGQLPGTGPSLGYSQCDCINLPDEKLGPLVFSGRLKQNVLEDRAIAPPKIEEANVRYDHLKFVLMPDRKISGNLKQNCFPQGYEEGIFYFPLTDKSPQDIFDCRIDISTGTLICGEGKAFATRKGIAYFADLRVSGADITKEITAKSGDSLDIAASIQKIGSDKCIKASIDNVVFAVEGVKLDGVNQYQLVSPPLIIGQKERIEKPSFVDVFVKELPSNLEDFAIKFKFYDVDNKGFIDFTKDEVDIDDEGRVHIRNYKGFDKDGKITIDKKGVKIQIVNVAIPKDSAGKPQFTETIGGKEFWIAQGTIRINKPEQTDTSRQTQLRVLKLELFHIKDDRESYSTPDDCNLQDPVFYPDKPQERKVNIRLEQSLPKELLSQDEKVVFSPALAKKGQPVAISVNFVNPSQIDSVVFSYITPDGSSEKALLERNFKGAFSATMPTDGLKLAGEVKGKLAIAYKDQTIKEKDASFEVQCGDERGYGICDKTGSGFCKSGSATITNGLECAPPLGMPT